MSAMNLTLRVIGDPDAGVLTSFQFYAGEQKTLTLQLFDSITQQKVDIPTGAIKVLTLPGTPDDLQIGDADIMVNANDPSIFSTVVSAAMSRVMITGGIQFSYTLFNTANPPVVVEIRMAYLQYGLKKMIGLNY